MRDGKRAILVVEDDEASAEMLEEILQIEGYAVTVVGTAVGALAAMRDATFDATLLDLTLPGLTSEQLVREVAALSGRAPVIVFSARPPQELAAASRALEAVASLQKPSDLDELLRVVQLAVDVRRRAVVESATTSRA
jgi:DNA-binding response OmpR family regulator